MKILIISKKNMLNWGENLADALLSKKIIVNNLFVNQVGNLNNIKRNILKMISKDLMNKATSELIEKKISTFKPDLIIVISPFMFNCKIFDCFDNFPNILKYAWIGDKFKEEHNQMAEKFNKLYCTDTSFLDDSKKMMFPNSIYLPLAVNERVFFNKKEKRKDNLLFIASYTKERLEFINKINSINLKLIGPKWNKINLSKRIIYLNKTISIKDVVNEYNNSKFILNIKHEHNVLNGLNMRTFEAIASGGCLLQDYVKDIDLNFEINEDIVVYNNLDELNELIIKLSKDNDFFNKIISNGEKNILSNHTYSNRVDILLKDL